MNRIFQRSWITPVVALSFAATAITGLMMFFHLRGHAINSLHEFGGLAFAAAGMIHLIINWKAFLTCFRKPYGIAALVLCSLICLALIFGPETHEAPRNHDFRYGGFSAE